jgi:hypothetical protein
MRKVFLLMLLLVIGGASVACPICGCGVGNFYMGLLPNFKNKFIGLRYQYLHYHTQIAGDPSQYGNDYYHSIELWGGWSIGKKLQLLAFIPYQVNVQKTDDGNKQLQGLADITLLANYKIFDKIKITGNNRSNEQQLWIGGGLKLPTGKYRIDTSDPETELGDVNSQLGTGSVDFLINTSYNIRINKFGINTTADYKINTTNSQDYSFGNRFNASSFGYYQIHGKGISISPNIGLMYQHAERNLLNNAKVEETGGYLAMAATGAEFSVNNITIGANVQVPFSQNFAHGQTEAKTRGMLHVSFSF